jgi:hypothetical protein
LFTRRWALAPLAPLAHGSPIIHKPEASAFRLIVKIPTKIPA